MKNFLKYWIPTIIWAGIIFTLSSIPNLKSDLPSSWDLVFRKIAHMAEYGVFSILLLRAFSQKKSPAFYELIAVFLIGSLYAMSDEIHQASALGRHGSIWDIGIDTIGIIGGLFFYYFVRKRKS